MTKRTNHDSLCNEVGLPKLKSQHSGFACIDVAICASDLNVTLTVVHHLFNVMRLNVRVFN